MLTWIFQTPAILNYGYFLFLSGIQLLVISIVWFTSKDIWKPSQFAVATSYSLGVLKGHQTGLAL